MPKVSVVVPVYNTARFLEQCLDSLCNQTLEDIEIICVDDESQDNSVDILETYQKKDARIQIYHKKNNGLGAAGARNVGLEAANGEYVIFLDSDDYFDLALLEKTYRKAKETDADIVMFDAQQFDSKTGSYMPGNFMLDYACLPCKEVFSWKDYPDKVFQVTIGAAWVLLIRNQSIRESGLRFQEVFHADDFFFTYGMLSYAKRVTLLKEKLVYYRINNSGSQTENRDKSPLSAIKACKKTKDWLEEQGLFLTFRRSFLNKAAQYCQWYLEHMYQFESFAELYDALQEYGLRQLELSEASREDFDKPIYYIWVKKVQELSREEFLHWNTRKRGIFDYGTEYLFPKSLVEKSDKVILYGAGNVGMGYYIQNIVCPECDIVLWVDKNYAAMGSHISNPERILDVAYDKVIIAIENPLAVQSVKRYLKELGVLEENIIWAVEENRMALQD